MKEVTKWDNNPRMMWVWDNNPATCVKRKVVYFSMKDMKYPVIVVIPDETAVARYKHCAEIEETQGAEIEETQARRMTNQELAWRLRGGKNREWLFVNENPKVYSVFEYYDDDKNSSVRSDILIRENGGEWHEPLVEAEK